MAETVVFLGERPALVQGPEGVDGLLGREDRLTHPVGDRGEPDRREVVEDPVILPDRLRRRRTMILLLRERHRGQRAEATGIAREANTVGDGRGGGIGKLIVSKELRVQLSRLPRARVARAGEGPDGDPQTVAFSRPKIVVD